MDDQAYKVWMSAAAMALRFAAFVPYIRSILAGATRPHVFSWVVWGTNTCVAYYATLSAQGGTGAWAVGFSGAITLLVAALAYAKRADITITRTDWLFFIAGLAALPLWFIASIRSPRSSSSRQSNSSASDRHRVSPGIDRIPSRWASWASWFSATRSSSPCSNGIRLPRCFFRLRWRRHVSPLIAVMAWRRQTMTKDTQTKLCRETS